MSDNDRTRESNKLLTPKQVSYLFGIPVQTLANWRCTKRYALPWVKLGKRSVRYYLHDVQDFINRGRRT